MIASVPRMGRTAPSRASSPSQAASLGSDRSRAALTTAAAIARSNPVPSFGSCAGARFTVTLGGRTCRLGNTIPFRFLARLADSPGRYVSHEQLIEDVWDGHGSDDALRSVVKHLRRRLREAGLDDLAAAINGLTPGYFALRLGSE